MPTELLWRVHTPNLLKEIGSNPECGILRQPLHIFALLLQDVGRVAIRIDDPELHALMIRLALYSVADPESPDYDPKVVKKYLDQKVAKKPKA